MAPRSSSPVAGGFPIAAGAIGGTILGVALGQPTIGFLIGMAAGIGLALLVWLLDR